jgi:hypothetical protein
MLALLWCSAKVRRAIGSSWGTRVCGRMFRFLLDAGSDARRSSGGRGS